MTIDITKECDEIRNAHCDDYADQRRELAVHRAAELCVTAVQRIADSMLARVEERDAVEFDVAMKLLARFQGRMSARMLATWVEERCAPSR